MNPRKNGTIFIVLMIALVAYGFGSVANAMHIGGDVIADFIPSNLSTFNQQQIAQINDPFFKPVHLVQHIVINTTNTTTSNETDNNSGNWTLNQDN